MGSKIGIWMFLKNSKIYKLLHIFFNNRNKENFQKDLKSTHFILLDHVFSGNFLYFLKLLLSTFNYIEILGEVQIFENISDEGKEITDCIFHMCYY